jgi:hypothetical protein
LSYTDPDIDMSVSVLNTATFGLLLLFASPQLTTLSFIETSRLPQLPSSAGGDPSLPERAREIRVYIIVNILV